MASRKYLNLLPILLIAATAVAFVGSNTEPAYSASRENSRTNRSSATLASVHTGNVSAAIRSVFSGRVASKPGANTGANTGANNAEIETSTRNALGALASAVRPLSNPSALSDAFESYFAFRAAHPDRVRKPYLYFVDYGLPSTQPRGYVFNMDALSIVDGPFMVAHGRGSAANSRGIPTRFSNAFGAATTSLGLYVAQELYAFTGHSGGQPYHSIGLRLAGVSGNFNDNARARGVVAHGAPYVTSTRAGRSEGCPAMEPTRARQLLPRLANGGLVFLFAPDSNWMTHDPWIDAG
jgi:hypothetical protein